jgi:hypothetical protein
MASTVAAGRSASGGAVIEDTVRRYLDAVDRYREFSDGLGPQSNSGPPFPADLPLSDSDTPTGPDPAASQQEGPGS